jgi:hypothetical protein
MAGRPVTCEVGNPRVATKGGHVEYEVTFATTEIVDGSLKARQLRWTIWRRFKEFAELDAALHKQYGEVKAFLGCCWAAFCGALISSTYRRLSSSGNNIARKTYVWQQ